MRSKQERHQGDVEVASLDLLHDVLAIADDNDDLHKHGRWLDTVLFQLTLGTGDEMPPRRPGM